MKYQKLIFLFILILLFLFIAFYIYKNIDKRENSKLNNLIIGDHAFQVEIVTTQESIAQGLSDRDSIGSDGMLFILPQSRVANFWMKDMKFNLDFIWIKDKLVIGINKGIKAPIELDGKIERIKSPGVVDMVLEVDEGFCEKNEVRVGDKVSFN